MAPNQILGPLRHHPRLLAPQCPPYIVRALSRSARSPSTTCHSTSSLRPRPPWMPLQLLPLRLLSPRQRVALPLSCSLHVLLAHSSHARTLCAYCLFPAHDDAPAPVHVSQMPQHACTCIAEWFASTLPPPSLGLEAGRERTEEDGGTKEIIIILSLR